MRLSLPELEVRFSRLEEDSDERTRRWTLPAETDKLLTEEDKLVDVEDNGPSDSCGSSFSLSFCWSLDKEDSLCEATIRPELRTK